ncbi:hypothetical protein NLG97_g2747 [Lecanicillium saksenae]|uniref:Uncharacterized protein n=1 Tax=Lecanicillium saksenae TaxID=468837 RepID=A0ACC1R1A0_9HYPO|nr:hypothetical protein NLG97_g2747 [Lecanicillium saksenae]
MQSYRQYLRDLPQFLAEEEQATEDASQCSHLETGQPPIAPAPNETPSSRTTMLAWHSVFPSKMEQSAANFFTAMFAWNEVLSSAAQAKIPEPQTKLRTFFADSSFSSVLKNITGCDAWILGSIMDVTALEVSKRHQLSNGSLSVRGLVSQASKIEAALELQMKKLSRYGINSQDPYDEFDHDHLPPEQSVRPRILGHAIIIYLNTVVSGALSGVPEIHQSICEVLPLWEKLSATPDCKYLTWAYSTTASLAAGSQRPAFKKFITNTLLLSTGASTLRYFRASVEECWKEIDRHAPNASNVPCDWRDMHMRENMSFIFL